MNDRIDQLLRAASTGPRLDHALDGLEGAVWRRIAAQRANASGVVVDLRVQLVAAGAALCIGLAMGWSSTLAHRPDPRAVFVSYEEAGPLARLEGGL
jgi:hypothetical protein